MKKSRIKVLASFIGVFVASALLINFVVQAATTIIDDTFTDSISTNQDLPNNSLAVYKSRSGTTRTDANGSVEFNMTAAGSGADGHWAYFTNSGSPVTLGVGDSLGFTGTFSLTGVKNIGSDIRFGLFNSNGTRQTTDLTNGHSSAAFADDPGYGAQFVVSATGTIPFTLYRRDAFAQNNIFTSFTGNGWTSLGASTAARRIRRESVTR